MKSLSKSQNQGPRARRFVAAENDSSCLIQTRFVGEMSQRRSTRVCSFEMFHVIKNVRSVRGAVHKHNDYRINVHVNACCHEAWRRLSKQKLFVALNVNPQLGLHEAPQAAVYVALHSGSFSACFSWGQNFICDLWHSHNYSDYPTKVATTAGQEKVTISLRLLIIVIHSSTLPPDFYVQLRTGSKSTLLQTPVVKLNRKTAPTKAHKTLASDG